MELPDNILKRYATPKGPRTPREEQINNFVLRLNATRGTFKPVTYGQLAKKFKGMSESQLYALYRECEHANSFSRLFWWKLKHETNRPTK